MGLKIQFISVSRNFGCCLMYCALHFTAWSVLPNARTVLMISPHNILMKQNKFWLRFT